jgi:hypothetical protein
MFLIISGGVKVRNKLPATAINSEKYVTIAYMKEGASFGDIGMIKSGSVFHDT